MTSSSRVACVFLIVLMTLLAPANRAAPADPIDGSPAWDRQDCQLSGDFIVTGDSVGFLDEVDVEVRDYMVAQGIPNGSIAIVNGNGRLVLARGYTNCDAFPAGEEKLVATPDSRFRIGSVSKPITAVAIMQLIDRGLLDFDSRMLDHVPPRSLDGPGPVDGRLHQVKVDHLLRHRGGWARKRPPVGGDACEALASTDSDGNEVSGDPLKADALIAYRLARPLPVAKLDIIRFANSCKLHFNPGRDGAYSNYGFKILGDIIEDVTGHSYESYVKMNILDEVNACDTHLGASAESGRLENEVRYYVHPNAIVGSEPACEAQGVPWPARYSVLESEKVGGNVLVNRPCVVYPYGARNLENTAPAGGWVSTTVDLARFGSSLTKRAIRDGRNTLLPARRIREMMVIGDPDGTALDDDGDGVKNSDYGRGFFLNSELEGDRAHGGKINGNQASFYIFPKDVSVAQPNALLADVVVTLLFNREQDKDISPTLSSLTNAIRGFGGVLHQLTASEWGDPTEDLFLEDEYSGVCEYVLGE